MNTQKYRQNIPNPGDPKEILKRLNELVETGDFPRSDYQDRKTYVIPKDFSFPKSLINYFRRKSR